MFMIRNSYFNKSNFNTGVKLFGCGIASYFLYRFSKQQYLKYIGDGDTGKNKNDDTDEDEDKDKDKEADDVIHYFNKYYDKFDELEEEDLEEEFVKSLKTSVLFETTPKGNVIMYYDYDKESFIYYCDNKKDISYLYLEVVVRKYALTFKCKKIVVDIKKELKNAREKKNVIKADTKKTVTDEIFVAFKSYNRKGAGGSTKNINKKFILREQANRYTYNGKISDYDFIQKNEYKMDDCEDKMDYQTFKKLMAQKSKDL